MDDIIGAIAEFGLGVLAENAGEWMIHRFLLHGLGRRGESFWHYHWNRHHLFARRYGMIDPDYRGWPLRWNTHGKEALLILAAVLVHGPLFGIAPGYVAGVYFALACYYIRHRKAHLDPAWARRHLPWHWEHHMGAEPEANYCTTWPWFDWVMATRVRPSGR
jgi:hypothetical protein